MSVDVIQNGFPYGWEERDVTYSHRDGRLSNRYEVLDLRRYNQDPQSIIALKCAVICSMWLPCYFSMYTLFHIVRLPVVTIVNLSPLASVRQLWTLVKIPFYYISMWFAALQGIVKPMEGRSLFGALERDLHGGKTVQDGINYPTCLDVWKGLSELNPGNVIFAAPCMQPYGKINDPHIKKVEVIPRGTQSSPTA